MKKIFILSAMFVLFLAASVFAITKTNANPFKQSTQTSEVDYSKVVVSKADDNCCQPNADCCKGGACCKHKRK